MRTRLWLLGAGIVGGAGFLTALGQGWAQQGDAPGLRPPAAHTAPVKDLDKPGRPSSVESAPLPPLPAPPAAKLPPPPSSLLLPETPRANEETVGSLPARAEPAAQSVPARVELATQALPAFGDHVPAAKQDSALTLEWIGGATAQLNHPFACQILVRNTGSAALHQVMVRHRLGAGVTCKRSEPAAATHGDELIWTIGTLQPGQIRRLDLHLVASQRGPLNCHATATFASSAGQQMQVREPLLVVKLRAPEKGIAGEKFNLAFTVSNPGDGAAEAVQVKAELPDGLETGRGRVVTMDVGNLAPKENRTFQIPCVIVGQGKHTCRIAATATGNLSSNDLSNTEILEPRVDLAVIGPKLRYLDRHSVYVLKLTNSGSAPLTGATVSEVIPAGFKFHTASGGGRFDDASRIVHWHVGDVPPGQSREVTLDLIASAAGDHRLQAVASTVQGAKAEARAATRVETTSALVIEVADVDDPVEVGGDTAYEIRVVNAGTKMETNLEVTCTLPEQVEFKGAKSLAGIQHRLQGRELTFDPLPRLAPKADVIYRVVVRGMQAGDVRFRARVRADGMPESVLREESTRFYNDR